MLCLIPDGECSCRSKLIFKFYLFCCVSIGVTILVSPSSQARKFCRDEYSITKTSNETVLWKDTKENDDPIIFSNPNCIDENGHSISRICHEGVWIPKEPPICRKISKNEYCPDQFREYRSFCIIDYFEASFAQKNFLNSQNTRRVTVCNGMKAEDFHVYSDDSSKKCCSSTRIQTENGSIVETNCNTSSFVILPYDHRFYICPENCIPSELGNEKCFCKVMGSERRKELAIVSSPARRKLLTKLAGTEMCAIENSEPSIIQGLSVVTDDFYGFSNDPVNCSIIETSNPRKVDFNTSMVLSFNEKKRSLVLLVDDIEGISPSEYYSIQCFTNAGTDIIRNVNMDKIKDRRKRKQNDLVVYELKLEKYIGQYWCEAFSLTLDKVQSNTVLAFKEKGNEYALRLSIFDVALHFEVNHNDIKIHSLQKKISSEIRKIVKAEVRFMKYLALSLEEADILLHLTITHPQSILDEYQDLEYRLKRLPSHLKVQSLRSVEFCLPDATTNSSKVLHWGLAEIWERKLPRELCFLNDQIPVTRVCEGDFISGASWSPMSGKCQENIEVPKLTSFLHETLYSNISKDLLDNIIQLSDEKSVSYLDIYLYSEMIRKLSFSYQNNTEVTVSIFKIINNLSDKDRKKLVSSQTLFNTTDSLLVMLDNKSSESNFSSDGTFTYVQENILIFCSSPFKSNISGIYLIGNSSTPLDQLKLGFLTTNETIRDIPADEVPNLELAVNVPNKILQSIRESTDDDVSNIRVVFTVFIKDTLFVSDKEKAAGKVISVTIPGFGDYLNDSLPIVLRSSSEDKQSSCGFWNLGQKLQPQKGEWSSFGGLYSGNFLNKTDLHICEFSHLTHFALLIVNERINADEDDGEIIDFFHEDQQTNFNLTVITIIGGTMSALGILGIYITAILFSQWRQKDGTKILLNLSTAILLEIVCLQFSGANELSFHDSQCKFVGCVLHYTLLSKFCWMLVYALLQYRRFVKVLGPAPKNLLTKSMCFGWGFALVPVLLTLTISPESYSKVQICYLHGYPLYFAVLIPVSLVTVSNLIVFVIVMYHVTTKKVESTTETKFSVLQVYLAILLFFVLGLPWLFVISSEFVNGILMKKLLIYLFCATATLQGFILFVFYVLVNEETRHRWRRYLSKN